MPAADWKLVRVPDGARLLQNLVAGPQGNPGPNLVSAATDTGLTGFLIGLSGKVGIAQVTTPGNLQYVACIVDGIPALVSLADLAAALQPLIIIPVVPVGSFTAGSTSFTVGSTYLIA